MPQLLSEATHIWDAGTQHEDVGEEAHAQQLRGVADKGVVAVGRSHDTPVRKSHGLFPPAFLAARRGAATPMTSSAISAHVGWSTPPRSSLQIRTPRVPSESGSS